MWEHIYFILIFNNKFTFFSLGSKKVEFQPHFMGDETAEIVHVLYIFFRENVQFFYYCKGSLFIRRHRLKIAFAKLRKNAEILFILLFLSLSLSLSLSKNSAIGERINYFWSRPFVHCEDVDQLPCPPSALGHLVFF